MAVQLHRRDALLVLGHEVDGLEPHRQRQFGGLEDGACGDRGLRWQRLHCWSLRVLS